MAREGGLTPDGRGFAADCALRATAGLRSEGRDTLRRPDFVADGSLLDRYGSKGLTAQRLLYQEGKSMSLPHENLVAWQRASAHNFVARPGRSPRTSLKELPMA